MLNDGLAAEIYQHKLSLLSPKTFKSCLESVQIKIRGESAKIGSRYGVSAKTIRDVWNRKTWIKATHRLWEVSTYVNDYDQVRKHVKS